MFQKLLNAKTPAIALVVLLLGACLFACVGCSQPFTIGSEADDTVKISVKNNTGQAITAVATKSSLDPDFSETLAQEGDWDADAVAEMYAPQVIDEISSAEVVEGEEATITEEQDIVLEPRTDIRFTTADGMTYELHQLNLEDIKDAAIDIEGDTAYLVYTSIATGEEVNTLEAERAYQEELKAQEEAQKAAEEQAAAEEQKAAEEAKKAEEEKAKAEKDKANQAKQSSSSSKSNNTSSGSNNNSGSGNSGSGSQGGSNSSSGEDNCVDDLIFN